MAATFSKTHSGSCILRRQLYVYSTLSLPSTQTGETTPLYK